MRTYNFKENRVTDHRIGLTVYKLDKVLAGELDEISDALVADEQARRLARRPDRRAPGDVTAWRDAAGDGARERLAAAGVENAEQEARWLVERGQRLRGRGSWSSGSGDAGARGSAAAYV